MSQLFRHGIDELKRLWERRSLKQRLAAHDAARAQCLGRLGERAVESTPGHATHQALRDQIQQLAGRAGDLSTASKALQEERDGLLSRRRVEDARFSERRSAIQQRKAPIDQELSVLRAQVRKQESATADTPTSASGLAADIAARTAASQQLASELDALAKESRAALQSIDNDVARVDAQLRAASTNAKDVEGERWACCVELGTAIHGEGDKDPALATLLEAVAQEDGRRAQTEAAFDRSMAATRAMPPNAFRNFVAASLAIALLVIGLPVGGFAAWRAWNGTPEDQASRGGSAGNAAASEQPAQPAINPFLDHPLKDKAPYVLANRLSDAKDEQTAQAALIELFRTIGVGVYTSEGQPVVMARDKNVYLYDFQVNTLAHTILAPSYMEFTDYSNAVAQGISKFKEPVFLQVILAPAIAKRWAAAEPNPDDPGNFLLLFIDGLARRQPEPYALNDFKFNSTDHLAISPVQSVLLLLEFFVPNDSAKRQARSWPILRELEPTLYADGPCEFIEGEDGKKSWGYGVTVLSEAAEESFGFEKLGVGTALLRERITSLAELFDRVTGLVEFMGDMITLYGIDIKVEAHPPTIHLRHEQTDVDGVLIATVSFDPGLVPEGIVKCGWLLGKQMPPKGPLKDVEVSWRFIPALQPRLALHPKSDITSAGSEGLKSKTDASGKSYFPLMASPCPDLSGNIEGQDYLAIATARVLTANIPTPTMITRGEGGSPGGIRPTLGATLPRVFLKFGPGLIEYFLSGRKGYDKFRAEWHKKKPPKGQYGRA
jgi:hypothetical protein